MSLQLGVLMLGMMASVAQAEVWERTMPLAQFASGDGSRFLFLRQTEDHARLVIPVPGRVAVESAVVHLVFTNSNALVKGRSQIRLNMNDGVFAQAGLDPEFPDGVMDASVPARLFRSGDNELRIEVAQHYRGDCEDPGSPELWTSIDLKASTIRIRGKFRPVPVQLDELDGWLRDADWRPWRPVLAPAATTEAHIEAGGLIGQALALRAGRTAVLPQVHLPGSGAALPVGDVIRFGLFSELPAALEGLDDRERERARKGAGVIRLKPREGDEAHFELLLAAPDGPKLVELARAWAWSRLPLGRSNRLIVDRLEDIEASGYNAAHAVREGKVYRFAELGRPTVTLKGLKDRARLDFWLPPDLFAESHMDVELSLHFSYGAGLRADSVLNVYHNGRFVRGISLADIRGLSIRDYRIRIPLSLFRPGRNIFDFEARMHAFTGSNCLTGSTDNLFVTLFEDSTIEIPRAWHYVAMPELRLATTTGFPYLGDRGEDADIVTGVLNGPRLAAAWALAGRLAALRQRPADRLHVRVGAPRSRHLIRLAVLSEVEPEVWTHAPVDLGARGSVNHPSLANPDALGTEPMDWRHKLQAILNMDHPGVSDERPVDRARIRQSYNLRNTAVWQQFENPRAPGGAYSLIVADNERELLASVESLVRMWNDLDDVRGDVLIWGKPSGKAARPFWSARVKEPTFHLGEVPYRDRLAYLAIEYPGFMIVGLLLLLWVLAWLSRIGMMIYRQRHHPDVRG